MAAAPARRGPLGCRPGTAASRKGVKGAPAGGPVTAPRARPGTESGVSTFPTSARPRRWPEAPAPLVTGAAEPLGPRDPGEGCPPPALRRLIRRWTDARPPPNRFGSYQAQTLRPPETTRSRPDRRRYPSPPGERDSGPRRPLATHPRGPASPSARARDGAAPRR